MTDQPDQPSQAVQDYLKAIHRLGGGDHVVEPNQIAAALGVKAPSVTGMLKRLEVAGWIVYTPKEGARLSEAGLSEALRVIRRHRLVELFLTRVLGLDWSEVDAEAEALEHAISPRLEQAIADHLGEPLEDPHGHPIPSRTGELRRRDLRRLSEFRAGQTVVIREVQDDNPARLRHWHQQGLTPGATVAILAYEQLDDLFEVRVGEKLVRLGSEGLAGLRGELAPGDSSPGTI
ncbi:family iron dependent repressor : Iron (Metal) dependent repressor, DtxR family OS=Herpetosiphon aurantiacus (strain ATCC 23779 / DSM 785) GN=Haur_4031 PE=4 SV=1: Fe_dep_repress: Fe_dep_repr_C: FeoA [Gemmataceae bacterium]|nr:family iron dependent repressor : Iron (Metal) dependent repressor, DtxR family OS=Herpetosiphon aurantiacus (strain ATCC 23779 / DSM 785) GN=Haur_4031 PE=4 SV=1: Fe_dep_repress: Fe_dep_repr_C: FeoA [Gemmataceae bacterium]VTU01708.1 family iron dependent repressor : Iron (Metal) dependent repressor, DtxR family OS=Herpetosiphon aurantiacus (strain ATCC 23779 / DSM 785) GN=Haur_4031 PE=4 SV=1: Fe_dep_repress: Fe_dep_repr_C: FeoA [Gemmataceae bacterium]